MRFREIATKTDLWPIFGHCISVLGHFFLLKMISVYWGAEVFGQFALVLALVAGVKILFFGPFTQWAIRDYQRVEEEGRLRCFFYVTNVYAIVATILAIVTTGVVADFTDGMFEVNAVIKPNLIILGVVLGIGVSLNNLVFSLFIAARFSSISTALIVLDVFLRLVVVTLILLIDVEGLETLVISLIGIQLIILIAGYPYLLFKVKKSFDWSLEGGMESINDLRFSMMQYAWPFLIWGVFGYFALMADKWVLASYVNPTELGIYSAMALVSLGLSNTITEAVNKSVVPVIFRVASTCSIEGRSERASRLVNFSVLTLIGFFVFLVLLAWLFPINFIVLFASRDFILHAKFLWLLMLAGAMFNVSQCLITHGLINRSPAIYLPSKIVHGIFVLICLLWLVPELGVPGAIYAILLGNCVQLLMVFFVNSRLGL